MADGGIGNQSPSTLFQARLLTDDSVGGTLKLVQYSGNKVVVSGLTVVVPQTGLARNIGDNLINPIGADTGAPPAASTLYYVYVSNKRASFSPSSIRLSAQAPIFVNGVKYLGNAGNALNWRFVGWVRPNATPLFESSLKNRWIVNYYNRFALRLFTCPGYVNNNVTTKYVFNPGNFAPVHGGVDDHLSFISNGEDSVEYLFNAATDNIAGATQPSWAIGVGEDSDTTPAVVVVSTYPFDANAFNQSQACGKSTLLSEGAHVLSMLMNVVSSGVNVFADSRKKWRSH